MTLANLARMSTATTGTGTITLGSAVTGFLTLAQAGITDGQTVTYAIEDGNNREIGRGVYMSSGTTLTRSVLKSTNSNSPISLSGSAQVFITAAAEDIGNPIDVQTFAASGTWPMPAGAKFVHVEMLGAGGSAASGERRAGTANRGGGIPGSGGAWFEGFFAASELSATESVTVGSGSLGGAAVTVDSTAGNPGTIGGSSSFGTHATAAGGPAGSGTGSSSNGATGLVTDWSGGNSGISRNSGALAATAGTDATFGGAGAGGAGGSTASGTTLIAGAAGGKRKFGNNSTGGTAGAAPASATSAGGDGGDGTGMGSAGGGGGSGGYTSGKGGNGGKGGLGGGGGGGGASTNGSNSGAGGAGGDGWVRITTW